MFRKKKGGDEGYWLKDNSLKDMLQRKRFWFYDSTPRVIFDIWGLSPLTTTSDS